jgi:hypothetical protein
MAEQAKLSPEEILDLATRGLEDPGFFCRTFFPEWFYLPMPWVHRGVLAILTRQTDWLLNFGEEQWPKGKGVWDEKGLDKILRHFVWRPEPDDPNSPVIPLFEAERNAQGQITAVHMRASNRMLFIMPRGISKTTLVNAANIRDIVQHTIDFLVYLSETATHSEEQLNNIKRELESNELLKLVYGVKQPTRSDPESWSQKLIETTDGIVVAAKGRGGQVRGMNHRGQRPNRIVFDDVEDKESVRTDEQRDKARSWLKGDVEPALPQIGTERGDLIGIGTIIHHDSLIVNLSKDPEWVVVKFGAIDPDGDMLWEHYMTRAQYNSKRRGFIRLGKLAEFGMEFDSETRVKDTKAKFPGPFIYIPRVRADLVGCALVCDPAISEKKGSDYCSFGVVGMTERGQVHVMDFFAEVGMSPREQVDKYFELHFLHQPNLHGIEAVAYQKALIHLVREEMFRKGKTFGPSAYFNIEPILHGRTAKVERVEGILSPRYTAGYVSHQRRFPQLEEQLLDWPNGKKDGPDVVAMAVTLLDPYAAFALEGEDADGTDKLAQDQYQPLDEELAGSWRAAP